MQEVFVLCNQHLVAYEEVKWFFFSFERNSPLKTNNFYCGNINKIHHIRVVIARFVLEFPSQLPWNTLMFKLNKQLFKNETIIKLPICKYSQTCQWPPPKPQICGRCWLVVVLQKLLKINWDSIMLVAVGRWSLAHV